MPGDWNVARRLVDDRDPSASLESGVDEEELEEAEQSRRRCFDCQEQSPKTHTAHTLISSRYGWRLTRRKLGEDTHAFEWRCPACWASFKARGG